MGSERLSAFLGSVHGMGIIKVGILTEVTQGIQCRRAVFVVGSNGGINLFSEVIQPTVAHGVTDIMHLGNENDQAGVGKVFFRVFFRKFNAVSAKKADKFLFRQQ